MPNCVNCKALYSRHGIKGRGLCRHCHKDLNIRYEYPSGRGVDPWTPEDNIILVQMRWEGQSAKEIAEKLGRSRWAVYGRIKRMGLSKPKKRRAAACAE
jgi:transposase-like protein